MTADFAYGSQPMADVVDRHVDPTVLAAERRAAEAKADGTYPEPEDRGRAHLSALGRVEYVDDLLRPGRILVVAAEEGTGKSYLVLELAIRLALAGGDFAGTWRVRDMGPVLLLSEQHPDDDYVREDQVLAALGGLPRTRLVGGLYRLPVMTAANREPALKSEGWRDWITEWLRQQRALAVIFDTATAASGVEPWGLDIQELFRGLRRMIEGYPDLAVVLVVHLRKPQGRGERRLSDVLGEWARWCDVVLLLENDGASLERVKVTVRKRVRQERRFAATKRDGLLVEPEELRGAAPKVAPDAVRAALEAEPGLSTSQLADRLGVQRATVRRYLAALPEAVQGRGERGARTWHLATGGNEAGAMS